MVSELAPGVLAAFIVLWVGLIIGFIFLFVFWIYMLVDVAQRKFKNDTDKVVWVIIIALLNWLGALIYYFVIKRPNKH